MYDYSRKWKKQSFVVKMKTLTENCQYHGMYVFSTETSIYTLQTQHANCHVCALSCTTTWNIDDNNIFSLIITVNEYGPQAEILKVLTCDLCIK